MKCSVGDMFSLILDKIAVFMLTTIEEFLNTHPPYETIMQLSNKFADLLKDISEIPAIGVEIGKKNGNWDWLRLKPLCFSYTGYKGTLLKDCAVQFEMFAHVHGCDPKFEPRVWKQCLYARRDAICSKENPTRKDEYYALFTRPTQSLQDEFKELLGDSYREDYPALEKTFDAFDNSGSNTAARDLCARNELKRRTMNLDEMILACFFHHVEQFCPSSSAEDNQVETFLNEVEWQLPRVVWDCELPHSNHLAHSS